MDTVILTRLLQLDARVVVYLCSDDKTQSLVIAPRAIAGRICVETKDKLTKFICFLPVINIDALTISLAGVTGLDSEDSLLLAENIINNIEEGDDGKVYQRK